uniref:Uncharacterized protein n=1 Tax=Varanus komodoensis TaxID=61221 RepID=A0A8D2J1B6_VARKO
KISLKMDLESWNKNDQKLFDAVEKGDVGRVSALASKKTARPTKLNALGQSAYVLFRSPCPDLSSLLNKRLLGGRKDCTVQTE